MKKVKRGRTFYVPSCLINEVTDIKREDGIQKNAKAIKELVNYARIGREVNRINNLRFFRKRRRN